MQGNDLVNAISQYYSSENTFYVYLVPPKGCDLTAAEFEDYLNKESSKPVKIGENDDGTDKLAAYFEDGQRVKVKLFSNDKDLIIDMWEKIKKNDPATLSGDLSQIQYVDNFGETAEANQNYMLMYIA